MLKQATDREQGTMNVITPDLVVITGMSGAGRTEAMHTFEDLGYFCIDNLPPSLLLNLMSLAELSRGGKRKLAVVCDLRAQEFFDKLNDELKHIADTGVTYEVLFLDSRDDILLARFKATRRRHPLSEDGMTVADGIQLERKLLASARNIADMIIDTSDINSRELRKSIRAHFSTETDRESVVVSVFSFGFKHGMPVDADIIIDVRFLPNPYYEPELHFLTGLDEGVRNFVLGNKTTKMFFEKWTGLLDVVMPGYVDEGKQVLSIGIGCTGGQHRSVALAEETNKYLNQKGYNSGISHRDLPLADIKQR